MNRTDSSNLKDLWPAGQSRKGTERPRPRAGDVLVEYRDDGRVRGRLRVNWVHDKEDYGEFMHVTKRGKQDRRFGRPFNARISWILRTCRFEGERIEEQP